MKKLFCVQSVMIAFLLAGMGFFGASSSYAQRTKQLKELKAPAAPVKTDAAADAVPNDANAAPNAQNTPSAPNVQNQSYSVVIESKIGEDGKRVQTKKVWKDGVLVEDEEKTVEGTDGGAAIELDGQTAPGILLRSERSGDMPLDDIDANLTPEEMMRQMNERMSAMRARQAEMMRQFGFGGFGPSDEGSEDSFAEPVNVAPSEYWLGAVIAPVSPETAAQLGLDEGVGVVIRDILPDSPAAKAGLQQYDLLTKIGETAVGDRAVIGETLDANGDKTVTIEFYRKGKLENGELTPEKRPEPRTLDALPLTGSDAAPFGPNEKIRVVRPGMIVPAPVEQNAPAEQSAPTEKP